MHNIPTHNYSNLPVCDIYVPVRMNHYVNVHDESAARVPESEPEKVKKTTAFISMVLSAHHKYTQACCNTGDNSDSCQR